ncbi:MAG: cytochrome c3 family protein [Dehalococcoidia bacterium]
MPTSVKILVPIVGLGVGVIVILAAVFFTKAVFSEPFQVFGMGAGPDQPIAFPHDVHVEKVGIECAFCHRTADTSEAAGIPAVQQCLFCHQDLGDDQFILPDNSELIKLREFFLADEPIDWKRVHRLPDHVQFPHEAHINAGINCSTCHGDVGSMQKVEQVRDLKMGDCVDCHRANNAPTDCVACHY